MNKRFLFLLLAIQVVCLPLRADVYPLQDNSVRHSLLLDGEWQFALDASQQGEQEGWYEPSFRVCDLPVPNGSTPLKAGYIQVPGIWDNQGYGGETDMLRHHFVGWGWYKRTFTVPKAWKGQQVLLTFGGVSRYAKVWINGQEAGQELMGQIAGFQTDITALLRYGKDNDITVRLDSHQRWEVDAILGTHSLNDYMGIEWGGLWGHVSLDARPAEHLENLYLRTVLSSRTCVAEVEVRNSRKADTALLEVLDDEGKCQGRATVDADGRDTLSLSAAVADAHLWTPDTPYLYTVRVTLLRGGKVLDAMESRYGMRELRTEGRHLLLNGQPIYLLGYGDDHIYPYEYSMPADKEMYLQRLRTIKAYGFNYVRHHSVVLPHEYYEACDEVGMLPQAEFSIAYPEQLPGGKLWLEKVPEGTSVEPALDTYRERFAQVVREYRNHPSILMWVMGNELWEGMSINNDFQQIAHTYDPDRFFNDSDGDWRYYFESGKDRPTLSLPSVLFYEWESPFKEDKFGVKGFKKPSVSHETGNFITFPRKDLLQLFDDGAFEGNPSYHGKPLQSDIKPFWMADGIRKMEQLGLAGEDEAWARASEELYYTLNKVNMENARLNEDLNGYQWWLIQDYWTTSNGLLDLFFRPKSIAPERVKQFNDALVVLQRGMKYGYTSGEEAKIEILLSNYSSAMAEGRVLLTATVEGRLATSAHMEGCHVGLGEVKKVGTHTFRLPQVQQPADATLTAVLVDKQGREQKRGEWHFRLYPATGIAPWAAGRRVYASSELQEQLSLAELTTMPAGELSAGAVYVTHVLTPQLMDALQAGAGVVLLDGGAQLPGVAIKYQQNWWKAGDTEETNHTGTYIYPTPLMNELTDERWCTPDWKELLEGAVKYNLEQLQGDVMVHIRALNSYVRFQNTAVLLETHVGKGTLVVSGLNHLSPEAKEAPANTAVIAAMVREAARGLEGDMQAPRTAFLPDVSVPEGTVLGYMHKLPSQSETLSWKSYLSDSATLFVCRQDNQANTLSWCTDAVPTTGKGKTAKAKENTVTFVMAGGLGFNSQPATDGFQLLCGGQEVLTFDVPAPDATVAEWKGTQGAVLRFDIRRRVTEDAFGVFYLTVPQALLTHSPYGEQLTVRSRGEGSRRWFGLNPVYTIE